MDNIQRFLLDESHVRGEIVHMTDSFHTIMTQHDYPLFIRELLGETMLIAVMMANTIKFKGQLTIQFQSNGPLKTLVAKCNHENHVSGFVDWDVQANKEAVQAGLGAGQLVITIAPHDHQPYQSIVPLQHRTVTEALEAYFAQSEQLSTRLWCAIDEHTAAGMILQLIPDNQDSSTITQREKFWEHATKLGETITDAELLQLENSVILHRLYHQEGVRVFEEQPVTFKCSCTLMRMQNAVRMMGKVEIYAILKTGREIEVKCEYCNNLYIFDKIEIAMLFQPDSKAE